jgi:hypothetical protein
MISTLAAEEKGKIVSIAVRPGKVDTAVRFLFVFCTNLFRGLPERRCNAKFVSLAASTWHLTSTTASYGRRKKAYF